MNAETAVDHHFVPVGMLRRWSIYQDSTILRAFYWDNHRSRLASKSRGPRAFCYRPHLLTAVGHPGGDDFYERNVFGAIDDAGALAITDLLDAKQLPQERRKQFTEFLLSLEARRPAVIEAIRTHGARRIAAMLDSDPTILQAVREGGHTQPPSLVQAKIKGMTLADELMHVVEMLARKSSFADLISSAYWQVRWADPEFTFALGDRPLIRLNGTGENMVWVLPLSPQAVFIATGNENTRRQIASTSGKQLARAINSDSAMQCDKYVFWTQEAPTAWLERRLSLRHRQPKQAPGDFRIAHG